MISTYRAGLLCLASILCGCAGGTILPFAEPRDQQTLVDRVGGARVARADVSEMTPQRTPAQTTPTLEVTLERTGQVAVVSLYSERKDASPGVLQVWRSADGSQIVLRGGVLIATRGLGNDIESTLSRMMVATLSSRGSDSGPHRLYRVTSENGTEAIDLKCKSDVVGDEAIPIAGQQIATRHVQVTCRWDVLDRVYDFWVDEHQSTVWRSRQWAGPDLVYIRTRILKE